MSFQHQSSHSGTGSSRVCNSTPGSRESCSRTSPEKVALRWHLHSPGNGD
jgi:hypothetical protein